MADNPAPYPADSKGMGYIEIDGKRISLLVGDGTKFNPALDSIPDANINAIANYTVSYDHSKGTFAYKWLHGQRPPHIKRDMVLGYARHVKPPPSASPLPGSGAAGAITHSITDLISALFDPQLWVRIAEVAIGLVLLGIGVAHFSTTSGNTLRSIPAYGKLIPK